MLPKSIAASFILLLLIVPAASASDDASPALGHAMDDGTIQLTLTMGGAHEAGDVLPICPGSQPVEAGDLVHGIAYPDCFQATHISTPYGGSGTSSRAMAVWAGPGEADTNPGPICEPIGGSILPPGGPPVVVRPNEACINAIAKLITGSIPLDTRFTR